MCNAQLSMNRTPGLFKADNQIEYLTRQLMYTQKLLCSSHLEIAMGGKLHIHSETA